MGLRRSFAIFARRTVAAATRDRMPSTVGFWPMNRDWPGGPMPGPPIAFALASPFSPGGRKWAVPGSNQRPPACKAGALPTELTARAGAPSGIRPNRAEQGKRSAALREGGTEGRTARSGRAPTRARIVSSFARERELRTERAEGTARLHIPHGADSNAPRAMRQPCRTTGSRSLRRLARRRSLPCAHTNCR